MEFSGSKQKLPNGKVARTEEKPVDLIKEIIERFTDKQDIVMDCFMGTGTAAVASLALGRRFYGCDIDREVVNIAVMRVLDQVKHLFQTSKFIF